MSAAVVHNVYTVDCRCKMLNSHFNDVPFKNCHKFFKICLILANCKNVKIFDNGNFIYFEGNTFFVFDLVMYIYHKSITTQNFIYNCTYEMLCNQLKISKML